MIEAVTFISELTRRIPNIADPRTRVIIEQKDGSGIGVAISIKIGDEVIAHCHQCGALADTHTNCANIACHLLFIQCEICKTKFEACCSVECQEIIQLSEEQQKALRHGQKSGSKIFKRQALTLTVAPNGITEE